MTTPDASNRILIIDDNPAIHEDFRKILTGRPHGHGVTDALLSAVLDRKEVRPPQAAFELEHAFQGQEAVAKVETALAEGRPYPLAFVDVRMPPGWDGIETIAQIWARDPAIQIVICTAYSDYSWQQIVEKVGSSDRLVILKKPFDNIEVLQLAHAMTQKWLMTRHAAVKLEDLDRLVHERTRELETLNRQLTAEIADREHAQAAQRLSEERLASAFDACPLPTAILRVSDQLVIQANPALLAATERHGGEIVTLPFWAAGIEAPEDFRKGITERLESGEALRRHECEFRTKSGELRRGLLWMEPFALAAGPHVLAILQDITEQHSLETKLRQAQKMEAVGHLAAGVAHDFNNLLTVIHGHSSLHLKNEGLDADVAMSLDAVRQAADRATKLTRQLLAFSRKQVMEIGHLCLDDAVTNVSAMLGRLIPENIQLHIEHSPEKPAIQGDRSNIEQVLVNLALNARDAMPRGGDLFISTELVEVGPRHVSRVPEARAGRFVCLQVRDTGEGMDETVLRHIFDPFFTTKEVGKGTGLGLATVHGIVKQHDGWIEAASTPGSGTTFRVFLPQTDAPAEPAEAASAIRPRPVLPMGNRTILLAEDDRNVRALVCAILEDAGMTVIEAHDGPSAFALWEKHRAEIDLLLTDMVMPGGLSGADLADRILKEQPELPVIYSSGYSVHLFNAARPIRKDINYLPKPYVAGELVAIIATALDRNGVTAAPRTDVT